MAITQFERLDVYRLAEQLADEVWRIVLRWPNLARDTIGKQIVRSADSIGANIAEGVGRGTYQDNKRFVHMARGSLYETNHTDYVLNPRGSDDQSRERKRPVPHPSLALRALMATQDERGFKA